jgi:arylsulfatase A-like enzyme
MYHLVNVALQKIKLLLPFLLMALTHVHAQPPNIIYIMADDLGYADLSSYGHKDYQTPNLDKLASQGMKFVNAYAAAPLCTPTRTALITGRYPARTPVGLIEPLTGTPSDSAEGLIPAFTSLPALMKAAGYETALIGKWHLGSLDRHSPTKNGYDYFFGIRSGAADYISHKGLLRTPDLFENDSILSVKGYLTDMFSQKAIDYVRQKHTKPFFLSLHYNAPHWPWQGPGDKPYEDSVDFRKGGSKATYAAMMKSLDDGIGKLMLALQDTNLAANTLVIFTSDNGGERFSDNGILARAKGHLWEGGIRVPAFVRWPGKIKPGQVTREIVVTMDWTATVLAAGGAKPDPEFPLDGESLIPVLEGIDTKKNRTLYWRATQRVQQKAMRMGDWKYLQDEKGEYLFNLANDEEEKKDRKEEQPEVFRQLKKMYAAWEKTVLAPLPLIATQTHN